LDHDCFASVQSISKLAFTLYPWHKKDVPRKIRQLVADLHQGGFAQVPGGKGSHRKFLHPKYRGFVLISGHDGDDAKHYQEKHVKNALKQVQS
jgi:predicted RNA binding protein YcfA (HicA-like mRNA interferase family)